MNHTRCSESNDGPSMTNEKVITSFEDHYDGGFAPIHRNDAQIGQYGSNDEGHAFFQTAPPTSGLMIAQQQELAPGDLRIQNPTNHSISRDEDDQCLPTVEINEENYRL